MLAKHHRFHGHGSLRYVYKNGAAVRSRWLTLKVSPNRRRTSTRVAVVVSKKIHKSAVVRNRIRRRIYEVMRHELGQLDRATQYDIVVIATSLELFDMPARELYITLRRALIQAGLYKKSTKNATILRKDEGVQL